MHCTGHPNPTAGDDERSRFMLRPLCMLLLGTLLCSSMTGCVFRRMTVRSDPPGALVMVDGEEVGYTPCSVPFVYYGTREITLVKPGYQTLTTMQKVQTPWYQYFPLEFFTDNFSPQRSRTATTSHISSSRRRSFRRMNFTTGPAPCPGRRFARNGLRPMSPACV
jgi:hypothetical protein